MQGVCIRRLHCNQFYVELIFRKHQPQQDTNVSFIFLINKTSLSRHLYWAGPRSKAPLLCISNTLLWTLFSQSFVFHWWQSSRNRVYLMGSVKIDWIHFHSFTGFKKPHLVDSPDIVCQQPAIMALQMSSCFVCRWNLIHSQLVA